MHDYPYSLRAGTVIAGYQIVRVLGEGGFGITYEGVSPVTGRRVALKEFFPRGIASRADATRVLFSSRDSDVVRWALDRFEQTTTGLCRLRHPNIVEVIHYIKDNDTGYMIMEYVEGRTLEHWLRARPTSPGPAELRPVIGPILDALHYVHEHNVIHRDIAPDNIMIRPDGQPSLIDFGAMKIIEQHTSQRLSSFIVTKANYAPPEQSRQGARLGPPVDVYAMAAVLYRAFAGRPPVDAEERKNGIVDQVGDPYVSLAQTTRVALPQSTIATIDQALAYRADMRPQSIAELSDRLDWDDHAAATMVSKPPGTDDGRAEQEALRAQLAARGAALEAAHERIRALEQDAEHHQHAASYQPPPPRARVLAGAAALLAIVIVWLVASAVGGSFILPSPVAVAGSLVQFFASQQASEHLFWTFGVAMSGWALGLLAANLLLTLPGARRFASTLRINVGVVLVLLVTSSPLFTLWFGLGVLGTFFYILSGIIAVELALQSRALSDAPPESASSPAQALLAHADLSFPIGLALCVGKEFFGGVSGLGTIISRAANNFETGLLFGLVILITTLAGGAAWFLGWLKRLYDTGRANIT